MEKIHPETGEILHRDVRLIEYSYKGKKFFVNQPGWYPAESDDGILSQEDMKVAGDALRNLKAQLQSENNFATDNLALA